MFKDSIRLRCQAVCECERKPVCLLHRGDPESQWGEALASGGGRKQKEASVASAQLAKCLKVGAGQTLVWVLALRGTCIVTCKLDPETSTFRGFSQGQVNACGLSLQGMRGRLSLKITWKGLAFPAALPSFREERAEQNIGGRRSPPG